MYGRQFQLHRKLFGLFSDHAKTIKYQIKDIIYERIHSQNLYLHRKKNNKKLTHARLQEVHLYLGFEGARTHSGVFPHSHAI